MGTQSILQIAWAAADSLEAVPYSETCRHRIETAVSNDETQGAGRERLSLLVGGSQ